MARIAIDAVIYVAAYATVSRVRRGRGMASRGLKDRIVAGIRVARAANSVRIAVIHVEERVILRRQTRRHPCRGGMACVAGRRPRRGLVIGVRRVVVIRDVATRTNSGQRGVVVVHVAARARNGDVGAGKWKRRVVVVKRALTPSYRVMAHLAGGRKTQLTMINWR